MDGILYPASLLLLAILAYTFNQTNNTKLALLAILIGVYIVYSQETGNTATAWKNDAVDSVSGSAENFGKSRGIEGFDAEKLKDNIE